MASSDALPIPRKNVAYRVTFPILDADGDLVTGATGLDSEVSKDAGTFADCTSEATEIATSSGVYYLDLTSTEMNADTVAIIVKTSSSGAKTTVITLYPEEAGDTRADVVMIGGDATAADNAEAFFDGTGYAGTNNVIPLVTTVTTLTNLPAITANWLTAAGTAADFGTEIGTAVWATTTRLLTAGTNIDGSTFTAIPWNASWDAEVQSEVVDGLTSYGAALQSTLLTVAGYLDTEIGAIITGLADVPTVAEFEARTLPAADYTIVSDLGTVQTGDGYAYLVANVGANGANLTAADNAVIAAIAALNNLSAAQVNAEIVDALATDTYAEPGQGAPAATTSITAKINYLYKAWRNKKTQTSTTFSLFADDTTTVDQKATTSDDGTTTTIDEIATGP